MARKHVGSPSAAVLHLPTASFISKIKTFVSVIYEVATEQGITAQWEHWGHGKYIVEAWDVTADQWSEIIAEASYRHLILTT